LLPPNKAGNTPLSDAQREKHAPAIAFLEDYKKKLGEVASGGGNNQSNTTNSQSEDNPDLSTNAQGNSGSTPTLADMVFKFKSELGVDGVNMAEIVDKACVALGVCMVLDTEVKSVKFTGGWAPRMGIYEIDGQMNGKKRFKNKTCDPQTWHHIVWSSKFNVWQVATNAEGNGGMPLYVNHAACGSSPELPPSEGWVLHQNDNTKQHVPDGGTPVLEMLSADGKSSSTMERANKCYQLLMGNSNENSSSKVLVKVEVGRVMSWGEYTARAKQEGGRLPTTAELKAASVDVGYDQWMPVTHSSGDAETGRRDGFKGGGENCWANIGPRKYVVEFPVWGLDANTYDWKRQPYFYVYK